MGGYLNPTNTSSFPSYIFYENLPNHEYVVLAQIRANSNSGERKGVKGAACEMIKLKTDRNSGACKL